MRKYETPSRYFAINSINLLSIQQSSMSMKGKCDECGMENVEVMSITKNDKGEKITLCNQCRPADGAYAY